MIFMGKCSIGSGSKLGVGGVLTFGDNFTMTAESVVICSKEVKFGENNMVSWNCQIMDTDFHDIISDNSGETLNSPSSIIFGDRVWIGSRATVLKGTILPDDTIVAACSLVTGKYSDSNTVLAGVPAKVIKRYVHRRI